MAKRTKCVTWGQSLFPAAEPIRINSPRDAGTYLGRRLATEQKREVGILALGDSGEVLGESVLGTGADGLLQAPKEFFRAALRFGAGSCLVFDLRPKDGWIDLTEEDDSIRLCHRLRAAGGPIGVTLADFVIVTPYAYQSFRALEGWDREGG